MPRTVALLLCSLLPLACDSESKAKLEALEARVAALESGASKTGERITPLEALPQQLAAQQQSATTIKNEQASLGGRLARAEESIAALKSSATASPTTPTTPPTTLGTEGGTAEGWPSVGVPECDEYITKYARCISDKLPESSRGAMLDAMKQAAEAWKEAAAGPAKDSLADACKAALDAARDATKAMGCVW
ncbi:MAG: hypothetical protein K1X88_34315 [Nannocystaceae bacterium]|nr:hypothetical protein [Nannocystaceae bacterium]